MKKLLLGFLIISLFFAGCIRQADKKNKNDGITEDISVYFEENIISGDDDSGEKTEIRIY